MDELAELRNRTIRHFRGKLRPTKCAELSAGLYLVKIGLKPSLLLDMCSYDSINVGQFVVDVLGRDACVLHMGLDHVVFYKSAMQRMLHSTISTAGKLKSAMPVFLDVSSGQPVGQCSESTICTILHSVRGILALLKTASRQESTVGVRMDVDEDCNLATLFGVLLGYPVVYWFIPTQEGNSLSNEDLCVFSISIERLPPSISFSVPVKAFHLTTVDVQELITDWFGRWFSKCPDNPAIKFGEDFSVGFANARIDKKIINMPAVSL